MGLADFLLILSRLFIGAVGTFFAILLWSQTRDVAWVLVIIGTLVSYAEIVLTTLERFGIISPELFDVSGLPIFKLILTNLPMLLFIFAFIAVLSRGRGV
jgi:hypothetical protein